MISEFLSLYDQHRKLISREEFEKTMAEEKTEQIEVSLNLIILIDWIILQTDELHMGNFFLEEIYCLVLCLNLV